MTDNNYPPLPEEEVLGFGRLDDDITGYTADQMHAYIDADRAQRKPLTDEQCEALAKAVEDFEKWWSVIDPNWRTSEYGHPVMQRVLAVRNKAMRQALNTPPRPDAGNN